MMTASLYRRPPADIKKRLQTALDNGLARGCGEAEIFFRADDIGVQGKQFSQLIQLFLAARLPLCLAVVPSWLTPLRFKSLLSLTGQHSSQWCWHQHGWLHQNHESEGKKQEFGSARPATEQWADLAKGKRRLTSIMGDSFFPFLPRHGTAAVSTPCRVFRAFTSKVFPEAQGQCLLPLLDFLISRSTPTCTPAKKRMLNCVSAGSWKNLNRGLSAEEAES